MSTPRFLAKSEFGTSQFLWHNGVLVLDGHATLSALLARQGGALGNLLAEPVFGARGADGPQVASWYAQFDGEAVPLTRLSGAEREAANVQLRNALHQLRPLLSDAVSGGLLGKALVIPGLDSVMVAQGAIILVNWGTAPKGIGDDPAALTRHWQATLGPYASFPPPWEASAAMAPPAAAEVAAASPPIIEPRRPAAAVAAEAVATAGPLPWYQRTSVWATSSALLFFLGLLLGFLLIGFYLPAIGSEDVTPDELALQSSVNNTLLAQVNQLRAGLQDDLCRLPPPAASQGLNVPVKPLEDGKPAVTVPGPPPAPGQSQQPAEHPSLATLLDKAAVLVLVHKQKGIGFGTGFFIAPNILATNEHVVEGGDPNSITISSKAIGALHPADILVQTQRSADGEDYAILKARDDLTAKTAVLPLTTTINKLDLVIAAGYPAVIIEADQSFQPLLEEHPGSAIPDLVATRGEVAAIQTLAENGLPAIAHTAVTSQGNSGGPLIDQCGRVVGINTFIVFDAKQSPRQGNYAIASADLIKFLQANQIPMTVSNDRCPG